MTREDGNFILKRALVCSIALHFLLSLFSLVFMFWPRPQNSLMMDIEVVAEGMLQQILENHQNPNLVEQDEAPSVPEKTEAALAVEEEPGRVSKIDATKGQEENIPAKEDPQEFAIPIPEKIPKKDKIIKKPVPKKNRKAIKRLRDIMRRAERNKKKKKIIEDAQKIAKKQKADTEFSDMMGKSISDLPKTKKPQSLGIGVRGIGIESSGGTSGSTGDKSDSVAIMEQITPRWIVPAGVKDAENIVVEIFVKLRDNGEVIPASIKIVDSRRYESDYIFRAAADSARRAILEASPLTIPKDKIGSFNEITFFFDVKQALRGQGG